MERHWIDTEIDVLACEIDCMHLVPGCVAAESEQAH